MRLYYYYYYYYYHYYYYYYCHHTPLFFYYYYYYYSTQYIGYFIIVFAFVVAANSLFPRSDIKLHVSSKTSPDERCQHM